jgi:hypothetical protein
MLNISLDDEAEQYLVEILSQEKITSRELVQRLLKQYWQTLQPQKTVLERMGDRPRHFLTGAENLSDREVRRALIAERLQSRYVHHQNPE